MPYFRRRSLEILEILSVRLGLWAAGGADGGDIKVRLIIHHREQQKLAANGNNSTRYEESCGTFYTGNDDRSGSALIGPSWQILSSYWLQAPILTTFRPTRPSTQFTPGSAPECLHNLTNVHFRVMAHLDWIMRETFREPVCGGSGSTGDSNEDK